MAAIGFIFDFKSFDIFEFAWIWRVTMVVQGHA